MTTELAASPQPQIAPRKKVLSLMASRYNIEEGKLLESLKKTVFKDARNDEELIALLIVSNQYNLNPFLKEIYAFPAKGGGIAPMIPIDGWIKLTNSNETFDGVEFEYEDKDEKPYSVTAKIYRKDRSRPTVVTEFYSECYRNTDPWNKGPRRQMRHKAYMQCARVAFGFGGIFDEDEARDFAEVHITEPKRPIFAKQEALPEKTAEATEILPPEPAAELSIEERPEAPWDGPEDELPMGDTPKFVTDTPQKAIMAKLHAEGRSEPEFFAALKALDQKTTARTVNGLSDVFAKGVINDWDILVEQLNKA